MMNYVMFMMIVMLNFIIASMSYAFVNYQEKMNGLFLVSLITLMPELQTDDHYGAININSFANNLNIIVIPILKISSFNKTFQKVVN